MGARALSAWIGIAGLLLSPSLRAEPAGSPPVARYDRDWFFLQAGIGLVEVGHLEAGTFVTPNLDVEAWLAWASVFGSRAGLGLTYAFGTSEGGRAPRGAFTVGARVMLNRELTFDNHGDDLSSYVGIPLGYAIRRDSGLYLRCALVPIVTRARKSSHEPPAPGVVEPTEHQVRLGGPFFTASAGVAF